MVYLGSALRAWLRQLKYLSKSSYVNTGKQKGLEARSIATKSNICRNYQGPLSVKADTMHNQAGVPTPHHVHRYVQYFIPLTTAIPILSNMYSNIDVQYIIPNFVRLLC